MQSTPAVIAFRLYTVSPFPASRAAIPLEIQVVDVQTRTIGLGTFRRPTSLGLGQTSVFRTINRAATSLPLAPGDDNDPQDPGKCDHAGQNDRRRAELPRRCLRRHHLGSRACARR
jgi:hypothetical protein